MRREPTIAIALAVTALIASACGSGSDSVETLGPVPTAQPTGNVSPTVAPSPAPIGSPSVVSGSPSSSSSPSLTVPITGGTATLTVTGDLQTSQAGLLLIPPAVYALEPGSFALEWGSAAAGVSLAGPTFQGTRPTSDTMRLSFFVHTSSATYRFTSIDGRCSATTEEADATFSGTLTCASITDDGGTVTVSAQGAFVATA